MLTSQIFGGRALRHCTMLLIFSASLALGGCANVPVGESGGSAPVAAAAKSELQFLDLQSFDSDLSRSLSTPLPKVDVAFLDNVKPSAMPERLQKWMASLEGAGGKVVVTPPKPALQGRALFAVVSAVTTVWSASKMAASLAKDAQLKAAGSYNAEIVLKTDASGDSVVDKVIFTKR